MPSVLDLASVVFPVLRFSEGLARVIQTAAQLTTSAGSFCGGVLPPCFDDMLIVESSGKAYQAVGARKLRRLRPSEGFFFFLLGAVRVELLYTGEPLQLSLNQVKERVFDSFHRQRDRWEERVGFEELPERIGEAQSITQILKLLDHTLP